MLVRRLLRGYVGSAGTAPPSTFYMLFNGSKDGVIYAIGAATSADSGVTWTPYASNPVISASLAWEGSVAKDPWLLWDGSQYVCYYSGYDNTNYAIGRATAPAYTGPWTKYGGNPILTHGTAAAFDESGVRFPTILYEPSDTGREWKCWYGADKPGHIGDGAGGIGYAYSTDGLSWTKAGQVLAPLGSGYQAVGVYPGGITRSGSTYHLYVAGYPGGGYGWEGGVYTFTSPTGTYTAAAGNPTLLTGRTVYGIGDSQVLTSDTALGSAVVHVSSTANWSAKEAMLLIDGNSQSEAHYIASIDSGTQITLDSVTSDAFTVAAGATIRPLDFNSVFPRTVMTIGGTITMFGTGFQTQTDLSPGGVVLRECSLCWTAGSLTGAWSPDYRPAGVLLPLYPAIASSAWDSFSAENPSVIVSP